MRHFDTTVFYIQNYENGATSGDCFNWPEHLVSRKGVKVA